MKALALVVVVLLFAGGVAVIAALLSEGSNDVRKFFRRRAQAKGLWRLAEESDGEQIVIYCVEPGTERKLLVGAAAFAAQDFDMQIELIRSEGRQKLIALNFERKGLTR